MNCEDNMCIGVYGTHLNNYVHESDNQNLVLGLFMLIQLSWKWKQSCPFLLLPTGDSPTLSNTAKLKFMLLHILYRPEWRCRLHKVNILYHPCSTFSYVFTFQSMRGILWKLSLPQHNYLAKIIVVIICSTHHFSCMLTFCTSENMRGK
jgi:hypothetical protein